MTRDEAIHLILRLEQAVETRCKHRDENIEKEISQVKRELIDLLSPLHPSIWRPISTAPLDGTKVEIWLEPRDAMESGNAHSRREAYFQNGEWWFKGNGVDHDVSASYHWRVTHWRPMS